MLLAGVGEISLQLTRNIKICGNKKCSF